MKGEDTMNENNKIYQWSKRDKLLYFISLIPFLAAFAGAAYLLTTVSIYLTIIFLSLYIMINFFQAGACIGCPYRGKYCPAFIGVYLGNVLSVILYKKRNFEPGFHKINVALGEIFCIITFLFPMYWLLLMDWLYLVGYIILITTHIILFLPLMCPKCSYNDTCPGGQAARKLCKKLWNKRKDI
jgi:hypothetical protein